MENSNPTREARIDKWLWAARVFKTRTMATAACKKGQVSLKGVQAKPSRTVKVGDVVEVRKAPVTYSFKVLQAIENRVGPRLVPEVMQDVTSKEQLQILELRRICGFTGRARGTGRPTKKDRRDLDDFAMDAPANSGSFLYYLDDDDDDTPYDE